MISFKPFNIDLKISYSGSSLTSKSWQYLFHGEFFLHVAHVDIATKSEKGRLLTSQF